jgi:nitroreductase
MKNTFLDLVKKRFSARKYSDKTIKRKDIEKCLEAARLAPSACNSQPWFFKVIDEPALKNTICSKIFTGVYKTNSFVKNAPVLVAVISKKGSFLSRVGAFVRDTRFYLIDIGIAVEHFVLQAAELGIGTCWIGWFDEKPLKKQLNLSKTARVDIIIAMGYPGSLPQNKLRKSLKEMSEFNT